MFPLLIGVGTASISAVALWVLRKFQPETEQDDIVSSRGRRALNPPLPYLGAYLEALGDPCDTAENPEGMIALCVAENKLVQGDLSSRLNNNDVSGVAFKDTANYCYNDMRGMMHVKESVARFITRKFLKPSVDSKKAVDAENVILGSGCAGLLNSLFFSLAEAGDGVLIPSPYYAAFESDMKVIAECIPLQVTMKNPPAGPTVDDLDASLRFAANINVKPKILLLTNPNNPFGTIYSAETIKNAIIWARSHKMHIIIDEIYALSIHDSEDKTFVSATEILDNDLGDDVHFLWALSKDFGSSGFRVGVLYTQNAVLNAAIGNLNIFSSVSHPMQSVVGNLLDDTAYVDNFLNMSRELLKSSYTIVTAAMEDMNIPYVEAQAGIFLYVDFSSLLHEPTFEGEAKLASLLIQNAKMILTPGHCQREVKPGMFRICYAWVSLDVLKVAMGRLKSLVTDIMDKGWKDDTIGQILYYKST